MCGVTGLYMRQQQAAAPRRGGSQGRAPVLLCAGKSTGQIYGQSTLLLQFSPASLCLLVSANLTEI